MRKHANTNIATNNKNAAPFANLNPYTYPNPYPNPVSKPSLKRSKQEQSHNPSSNLHFQPRKPSPARKTTSPDRKLISVHEEARESSHGGYVTFNVRAYTRRELKELKRRLVYELEQVRALKTRLETLNSETRPVHLSSQYSISRSQPQPHLHLNSLTSNPSNPKHENRIPKSYEAKKKGPSQGPGSKRTNPFTSGPNSKRQTFYPLAEKMMNNMMKKCRQILGQLMKQKYAWVFNKPVDAAALGLFDYHQIIKKPMDLGTVKSNLESHFYKSPVDFAADVRLTFKNAMAYNPKEHDVHGMAQQLLLKFNEMFDPACRKFSEEQLRVYGQIQIPVEKVRLLSVGSELRLPPRPWVKQAVGVQEVVVVEQPMVVVDQQGRVGKLQKPKARDPNKRGMSFEEKEKLGRELEELPDEKMMQLLQIVKKRNGNLTQDGNEIELDIGTMDTETIWELDRFVNNYKKMVRKIKRQRLIHSQPTPVQIEMKTNQSPVGGMGHMGNKVVDEDVDIGEEIPIGNYPPVEIEKDVNACGSGSSGSSSSSSSGSDYSSSSGSDSGSSSGSDSGADAGGVQSPIMEEKDVPLT